MNAGELLANDKYPGIQTGFDFAAGSTVVRTITEQSQNTTWQLLVSGENVQVGINWGVERGLQLRRLRTPVVATLAGHVQAFVQLADLGLPGNASVTMWPVGGNAAPRLIELVSAVGPLQSFASAVTALTGATISVGGTAVVLAAGQRIDVCNPVALTVGGPILVEHAI